MPVINKNQIKQKTTPYKHINNVSPKYYNTKLWVNLRNYYIRRNPLCEECLKHDKIKSAEHVHHKTPWLTGQTDEERWKLLLDEDNLESVCYDCHKELHKKLKKLNLS